MHPKLMIWTSVILMGALQIVLKFGMRRMADLPADVRQRPLSMLMWVSLQGWFWLWGALFSVSMVLWLIGLRSVDLSYAYPLVSVGYILVAILAMLLLKEEVRPRRWLAIAIICLGIWIIAGS